MFHKGMTRIRQFAFKDDIGQWLGDDDVIQLKSSDVDFFKYALVEEISDLAFTPEMSKVLVLKTDVWFPRSNALELLSWFWCMGLLDDFEYAVFANLDMEEERLLKAGGTLMYEIDDTVVHGGYMGKCGFKLDLNIVDDRMIHIDKCNVKIAEKLCLSRALIILLCSRRAGLFLGQAGYANPNTDEGGWDDLERHVGIFHEMTAHASGFDFAKIDLPWFNASLRSSRLRDWNDYVYSHDVYEKLKFTLNCERIWKSAIDRPWDEFVVSADIDDVIKAREALGLGSSIEALKAGVPVEDIIA